jgi:Zn-finger nucleic acid-binding protein
MSDKQGVEIDYCPQCRGIWLDRGELEKIIERSKQYLNPPSAPAQLQQPQPLPQPQPPQPNTPNPVFGNYQGQNHYKSDHYKKHKKRNFLEDIFDVFDT